ncbi:G1/S-specific cyclin-C [Coprinopsis cinerea AmutBmut pab1-1]|nr:G1/S-specific cyclin-C [Coprinopsis cinerea AmutBmut pab1-1]
MEFYLVDDLESDLVVYHPYRTLLALCRTSSGEDSDGEEGEEGEEEEAGELGGNHGAGVGIDKGSRYWGTGEGKLVLSKEALQIAWSIINDTYRSELCLLYPPHLIAIAALYLTFILHPPDRTSSTDTADNHEDEKRQPRRSSRQAHHHHAPKPPAKNPDPITFLAQLNVSLPLVATIAQEIISLYTLWERYKEDGAADAPVAGLASSSSKKSIASRSSSHTDLKAGLLSSKGKPRSGVHITSVSTETPIPVRSSMERESQSALALPSAPAPAPITTAFLSQILLDMRESRLLDLAYGGEGELLGLPPSMASSVALPGPGGVPLGGLHSHDQGSGTSSAASSVMTGVSMNQQYHLNRVLGMNAYG